MTQYKNPLLGIGSVSLGGLEKSNKKRTLGIRDKQILYQRAKGRCEGCGKKIEFSDMQSGHKNPASKGGSATLRNSVCVCYTCNKLQGTDDWATFMRKLGKKETRSVTSGKKRKPSKKAKSKASGGTVWVNPVTGKKEKIGFGFY